MPIYTFENPSTGETIEILQKMKDKHVYFDDSGQEWNRVWHTSNLNVEGTINPWSKKSFSEKTEGKNYTLGEMWDKSAELSAARAEKEGAPDPIKKQWEKDYSKKRKGTKYKPGGPMSSGDLPTVQFED